MPASFSCLIASAASLTERIFDADNCYQLAVNGHVKVRIAFRQVLKFRSGGIIYRALFIFEDEVIASDDTFLSSISEEIPCATM